jgi:hypothetical protein
MKGQEKAFSGNERANYKNNSRRHEMEKQNGGHCDRYKMFRNFMANELGITREDIKLWSQEAVKEQAGKLAGQTDIEGIVRACVRDAVAEVVRGGIARSDLGGLLRAFGYTLDIVKRDPAEGEG